MTTITKPTRPPRTDTADLQVELRALTTLVRELAVRATPQVATPVDEWLRKATPDQLLDRWIAVRGRKAEAFLCGRIIRRRATRRV